MSKISDKLREKIKRNNKAEFLEFLRKLIIKINITEKYANNITSFLNTGNYIQSIFGLQSEILDKLIIEIQSSEEWKNINTKSKKLPILNSNLKNNRKKLRKWLFEQRPTKYLSQYLAYEDKMKANITQILEVVKNGRALIHIQTRFYDSDEIIKLKCINDELKKITIDILNMISVIEKFIKNWKEQSNKDNLMTVNLNELIEWYKENEHESDCMCDNVSDRECDNVSDRERDNVSDRERDNVSDREQEWERESEANKLENILNVLYLFDK